MERRSTIVFVAGALRSGTTMLRLMLGGNSLINAPGEFDFAFDALGTDAGTEESAFLDPQIFEKFLRSNRIFLDKNIAVPSEGGIASRVAALADSLTVEKKTLVLFIHRNFMSAHEFFPNAKFIHIVRDPRDCSQSAVSMGWSGNVYHGTEFWLKAEQSWERLKPLLHVSNYIELKYEDVIESPEHSMSLVCSFLGVEYHPKMISLEGTTYYPLDTKHSELWKRKLSPYDINLIESRTMALMMRNGYVPLHKMARQPGRIERMGLSIQDRIYRHTFRISRYGIKLWLLELLTRRFGLSDVRAQILPRITEIDRRYLR
ncbi:MAG: sulfotransferase [Aestuariivirga sp.]|nr:sulfotransferase [Aestuariivirga sp.]